MRRLFSISRRRSWQPEPIRASMYRAAVFNCKPSRSDLLSLEADLKQHRIALARLIGIPLERDAGAHRTVRISRTAHPSMKWRHCAMLSRIVRIYVRRKHK